MRRIKFEVNDNNEEFDASVKTLLKDSRIQQFLNKNNKDEQFVRDNFSDLINWVNDIDRCRNCAGIEFCRQPMRGKVRNIEIDETGYLDDVYVSCRFMNEATRHMDHRNNYRFAHCSGSDYLIDLGNIDIRDENADYVKAFVKVTQSVNTDRGIYLYGQPGVGKSYLMHGVANYYAKQNKRVSFVKVPLYFQELKQSIRENDYFQVLIGHLRFSEVLILDDIGSESITAWTRDEVLFPILDYRMEHGLKTYFTSNYSLRELEEQYYIKEKKNASVASKRLLERIRTLSEEVLLSGESRR